MGWGVVGVEGGEITFEQLITCLLILIFWTLEGLRLFEFELTIFFCPCVLNHCIWVTGIREQRKTERGFVLWLKALQYVLLIGCLGRSLPDSGFIFTPVGWAGGESLLLCHCVMQASPIRSTLACLGLVRCATVPCWTLNTLRIKAGSWRGWGFSSSQDQHIISCARADSLE